MKSANPRLTAEAAKAILARTAAPVEDAGEGFPGRIDAARAVREAAAEDLPAGDTAEPWPGYAGQDSDEALAHPAEALRVAAGGRRARAPAGVRPPGGG